MFLIFRYKTPAELTVIQWIVDLAERMKQLQTVSRVTNQSGARELKNLKVWLGGLFMPEAFITASRQYVAQANQWSLEELYLKVTIADSDRQKLDSDDCSFLTSGMIMIFEDFIICLQCDMMIKHRPVLINLRTSNIT